MEALPPLARALRAAVHEELDAGQRAALLSWLAFTTTFGAVRGITWGIRAGKGPFRNLSVGGEHLHHYMWGIGLLAGVGAIGVHGEDSQRKHPAVAISYGAGLALIIDEFALLLDLKDVYWARQGRISVDLGIGGIAAVGSYFAALPALRAALPALRAALPALPALRAVRRDRRRITGEAGPGEVPGQAPGEVPGQAPGEVPGQAPGEVPGQAPG